MDDNQKKLIADQMHKIPAEVAEAIKLSDWERTVFNIGREHKMHIDDIDILSVETILTMIGLEHPKHFPDNIQKRIGLNDDELMNIVDEINNRLFSKIRDALKVHYEKVSAGEIMADEEKDELHHAGVELEDNYVPRTDKKPLITMVDTQKPTQEKLVVAVPPPEPEKPPVSVPEQQVKDNVVTMPKVAFDPYREPIE